MAEPSEACYSSNAMKMRLTVFAALTMAAPLAAGNASAGCLCRANGAEFEQGQLACLNLPDGPRLARCEKVLNNSSWKILKKGCLEMTELSDQGSALASLAPLPASPVSNRPQ